MREWRSIRLLRHVVALQAIALVVVGGSAAALAARARAASFTAVGSAEQVSVTGLAPSAQASLLTASGAVVVQPVG